MSPMTDNFAGSSKMRPTNFPVSPGIMNLGYWRSVERRICINQNGSPSYSSRQSRNSICTPTSALSVEGTTRCTNYIWPINRCGLFEVSNCLVFDIFIISPAQVQKLPSQKKKYLYPIFGWFSLNRYQNIIWMEEIEWLSFFGLSNIWTWTINLIRCVCLYVKFSILRFSILSVDLCVLCSLDKSIHINYEILADNSEPPENQRDASPNFKCRDICSWSF